LAKKFYVVWAGRKTGVFTDWATTQLQVDKFPGARFKSFPSKAEADQAFRAGRPPSAGRRPATAGGGIPARKEPPAVAVGLQIYCDGACDPNPGRAGSGIAVYRDGELAQLWYGLYNPNGTNNTAELNALHHALLMAEKSIVAGQTAQILCDSTYAINCISKWAVGWQKKGWRKAGGEIKKRGRDEEVIFKNTKVTAEGKQIMVRFKMPRQTAGEMLKKQIEPKPAS